MPQVYTNLPGFRTELQDFNLQVEPDAPLTQKVVILGTATDGPVGDPQAIRRPEQAEVIFGRAVDKNGKPNGATLLPKFYEAWNAGCRNIALVRISGQVAANTILADMKEITKRVEKRDQLGLASGNDETVFTMPDMQPGDQLVAVQIVANGEELGSSSFTFENDQVTLLADQTDSNADIAIEYSFTRDVVKTRPRGLLAAIDTTYTAFQSPNGEVNWDEETLKVWVNGVEIDNDATPTYTVDEASGQLVFMTALESDDVVEAQFDYMEKTQIDSFVTGLMATGSPQELELEETPIFTSLKVYADGYELEKSSYLIDAANKKVTLLPGHATNGSTLLAVYEYTVTETVTPSIKIKSRNAGSIYNSVTINIEDLVDTSGSVYGKKIVIIKPESKKTSQFEQPMEFRSDEYPTFGDLVDAVNALTRNNVVTFETEYRDQPTSTLFPVNNLHLSGGNDGLNLSKQEIYEKLGGKYDADGNLIEYGAYHYLANYDGDIYVPVGVYADDDIGPDKDFADQLAQFCAIQTLRNHECRGVISLSPIKDTSLPSVVAAIEKLVREKAEGKYSYFLKNLSGEYMRDDQGRLIDIGRHIDIVAYPSIRVSNSVRGAYSTTFEAAYAGLQSALASSSDTTQKVLPGVLKLDYEVGVALHDRLSEAGFVSLWTERGRGAVVVNGITAAQPGSDYRVLPNIRIALEAAQRVREVSRRYQGEPYNLIKKNAHMTDIQAELDAMVEEHKLIDFSFSIHQSLRDRILHNAVIMLDLVPAFALKSISMPVSLRPTL